MGFNVCEREREREKKRERERAREVTGRVLKFPRVPWRGTRKR